jgi:lysylphosphatidylglycerol synthetase-like protein (DUF2156 family)
MKKSSIIDYLWIYFYVVTTLTLLILGLNGMNILRNGLASFTLKTGDIWILTILILILSALMAIKFATSIIKSIKSQNI